MTTITLDLESPVSAHAGRLEELVDRLLATLFRAEADHSAPTLARDIHQARQLRQSGDLDMALAALSGLDIADATDRQLRWLYAEWLDIARRRFTGGGAVLYSPATGKAAVLLPTGDDGDQTLEVVTVLGMRWTVSKLVSQRSLRGLRPLHNKYGENNKQGGSAW